MSTKNPGQVCAECLQEQRSDVTCTTQGGGSYIATGFTPKDGRLIVAHCVVPPENVPGVSVVMCGQGVKVVNNLTMEAGRMIAQFLTNVTGGP